MNQESAESRRELFQWMIDGALDSEGERRVREILAADAGARREFAELAQLHAWLHSSPEVRETLRRIDREPENVVALPGAGPSAEPVVVMREAGAESGRTRRRLVAVAAVVALAGVLIRLAWNGDPTAGPAPAAPPLAADRSGSAAAAEPDGESGAYLAAALPAGNGSVNRPPTRAGSGVEKVRFNRDIRPLLADNCFFCHGPDAAERKADLRLDVAASVFGAKTGDGDPVLVRFRPDESVLWQRIVHDDPDELMPPPDSHKSLDAAQRDLIRRWIAEGAVWEEHWAFIPPEQVPPPEIPGDTWSRNEIDRFVHSEMLRHGLQPSPEADRRTLIRRATFDLTGLPPTPEEVEAFVADTAPDAWERLVDRLLASPKYGEHRARYWLDAARYGDTHGLHLDNYREMWPYRDWVIDAYNANMPFDRFAVEQLAGDLLPDPTQSQLVATGFNRCNVTTSEGGSIAEEYRVRYAVDRVETTSLVFLALTTGCAVCHDHKFDPISQKEFYEFSAFFNNVTQDPMDGNIPDTPPVIHVFAPGEKEKLDAASAAADAANAAVTAFADARRGEFDAWLAGPAPEARESPAIPLAAAIHLPCREGEGTALHSGDNAFEIPGPLEWRKVGDRQAPVLAPGHALTLPPLPVAKDAPFTLLVRWVSPEAASYRVLRSFDPATGSHFDLSINEGRPQFTMGGAPDHNAAGILWATPITNPGATVTLAVTWDGSGRARGLRVLNGTSPDGRSAAEIFDTLTEFAAPDAPVVVGPPDDAGGDAAFALLDFSFFPRRLSDAEIRLMQNADALPRWFGAEQVAAAGKRKSDAGHLAVLREYHLLTSARGEYLPLVTARNDAENARLAILNRAPITHIMRDNPDTPAVAWVLARGQYDARGEQVTPGTPEVLPPLADDEPRNRLALAHWMIRDDNPLTARVAVNRLWGQLFGNGIVRTPDDFGTQGTPPTHPELLDWLAVDFRANGWDVKRLLRNLMVSATYRQSSRISPDMLEADPENLWLARFPRMRLDAEEIRDQALAVAGILLPDEGGPSVRPYQPPGIWEPVGYTASNTRSYIRQGGDALYRRSLYTFWKRTAPPVALTTFDAPSREACTVRRERTNTPLQALALMNDVQYMEASRHFADRVLREGGDPMRRMCLAMLSRPPTDAESAMLTDSLNAYRDHFRARPEAAVRLLAAGESPPTDAADPAESAAWTMLASQLLNLDETITKE